ncbi:MAG: GNAT family N-acetyltransferase [Atopostipes suicloacalis]|nr:GNAT family N-acetyltransferase [Atopostipes suicloacalis]
MTEIKYINYDQKYLNSLLELWNKELIYDPIDQERFLKLIVYDENFDSSLAKLAILDTKVVGFCYGVKRKVSYYTRGLEPNRGWITYLFVDEEYQRQGIGEELYKIVENRLAELGTEEITLAAYSPNYLNPGIDVNYEKGISFFVKMGYDLDIDAVSMQRTLLDFVMPEKTLKEIDKLKQEGIQIKNYQDSYFSDLMVFLEKEFGAGWKRNFILSLQNGDAQDTVVICTDSDDKIIGYCMRKIDGHDSRFGPIGVAESERSKGLGGVIFDYMMRDMKKRGIASAYFLWTSGAAIKFYKRHGMEVYRKYKLGRKVV